VHFSEMVFERCYKEKVLDLCAVGRVIEAASWRSSDEIRSLSLG
jgi:hypothetical protein